MTRRRPGQPAAVVALAALLLALVACAPERNPDWTPPAWAEATISVTAEPAPLDPAAVPGLVGERVRNDTVGLQARWMRPTGDSALQDAALRTVRETIAARAAATGAAYRPEVFPPGTGLGDRACVTGSTLRTADDLLADPALGPAGGEGAAVVCDLVAAAGGVIGQRLRTVSGAPGAVASDTATLLYLDTSTGALSTARSLWTDAAPAALWEQVVDTLRRANGALSLVGVQPPGEDGTARMDAALAQTVPSADGALTVTLAAGFTAPELEQLGMPPASEPITIAVPPAVSAPLLTSAGAALAAVAGTPYTPPAPVGAGFESVPCDLFPCVALTYDDGPGEGTPAILDAAWAHHASVTFFAMGQKAAASGEVMTRALAEGNLVENHTWSHPHLPDIPRAQVAKQIGDTTAAIGLAAGKAPTVFRPPYGDYTAEVVQTAGMAAVLWDVDTLDWQGPADDELVRRAVDQPRPGSIVLQHDIQPNTVRTAGAVYDGLADRGFTLVNLEQLFGGSLPTSGVWRSGR
ncbi:polysaccharide deacetylase family protein [Microbacterium sp. GXF7504]